MKITEDYVSFEVAKLLKEKGFDGQCDMFKDIVEKTFGTTWNTESKCRIPIPTIPMACKWLRKEKNICIYVFPHKDEYEYGKWEAGICYCDDAIDATINACGHIFGETYEGAVEAALKYTLKNLI